MIKFHLKPDDLAELRFAYSPLIELSMSYHWIRNAGNLKQPYNPWVEEAVQELRGVELPFMDAVLVNRYMADFLTPTPQSAQYSFDDAIQGLRQTPDELIRKNVLFALNFAQHSDVHQYFLDHPRDALECLIQELIVYWQQTLAHHWPRITSALENDVLFRARQLALQGSEAVLADLHPILNYADGTITLNKPALVNFMHEFSLQGRGLRLVPAIFSRGISWQIEPEWAPMLVYSARGAGLWYENPPPPDQTLRLVIGESKTRILVALTDTMNTSELAHKLHVTASAVSQHLGVLGEAGLVESHRSGNRVFYRLSRRGAKLLDLFSE